MFAISKNKNGFFIFQAYSITNVFWFVLPELAASSNSTVSNISGSVNTSQGTSTTSSINSITDVTSTTGKAYQGVTGEVYQGNIG